MKVPHIGPVKVPHIGARDLGQVLAVAICLIAISSLWRGHAQAEAGIQELTASEREALAVVKRRPLVIPGAFSDTVLLFVDYRCAYCAALYPDFVRQGLPFGIEMRFALANRNSLSAQAAIAGECARQQGKFHPYSYALFSRRDSIGVLSWETYAKTAGVPDLQRHARCIAIRETLPLIEEDVAFSQQMGISSTPVAVFGNKRYVGPVRIVELLAGIARAQQ